MSRQYMGLHMPQLCTICFITVTPVEGMVIYGVLGSSGSRT